MKIGVHLDMLMSSLFAMIVVIGCICFTLLDVILNGSTMLYKLYCCYIIY